MAVKISELKEAARRYKMFSEIREQASITDFATERLDLGVKNAREFTSKTDRLSVLASTFSANLPSLTQTATGTVSPELLGIAEARQEAAFSDNDFRPIRYLHIAILAARAVGKVTVRGYVDSEGDATGFLVAPGVLLTNYHVLPSEDFAATSYVAFDMEDGVDGKPKAPKLFDLQPSLLYVSDKDLDYCFVAVSPTTVEGELLSQFGYLRMFEQTGKLDPNRRQAANIIQHPLGQGKKIVLRDNYFQEAPNQWDSKGKVHSLYYGTDTLKGSSGSPVCTDEWFVVALHRGGVPKVTENNGQLTVWRRDNTPAREGDAKSSIAYVTNEGTRVSSIYASLELISTEKTTASTHARAALKQISAVSQNPRLGPVDRSTAPLMSPLPLSPDHYNIQEKLLHRNLSFFDDAQGYQPSFLGEGFDVALPELSYEIFKEVARLSHSEGYELKYLNYSIVMHAKRRTAIYSAGNVDGKLLWKNIMEGPLPRRPQWTFDPRLEKQYQPDDSIFSTAMQRGHLFKREDAVQGSDDETLKLADMHSFVITNATPMIGDFNNVEWGDLEDYISDHLSAGNRASYFAGPIFDVEDKFFNELKASALFAGKRKGMRVPTKFWKIVAWVEGERLHAAGFVLDQSEEIRKHGIITEEIYFGAYLQTAIEEIENCTGLNFGNLSEVDTFGR